MGLTLYRPIIFNFKYSNLLSCIGPASNKIERILAEAEIKVCHSSEREMFQQLSTHKDKTHSTLKPEVHEIPCECGLANTGETKRNLKTRIKEHMNNCCKAQSKNPL